MTLFRKTFLNTVFVFILMMAAVSTFAADAAQPESGSSSAGVVNINTASAEQLALLPRVGAKAAERIVAYREEHGAFKKATDLMQVKGIGEKTYELLRPYLVIDGETTLSSKQSTGRKSASKKASNPQPANTAQQ